MLTGNWRQTMKRLILFLVMAGLATPVFAIWVGRTEPGTPNVRVRFYASTAILNQPGYIHVTDPTFQPTRKLRRGTIYKFTLIENGRIRAMTRGEKAVWQSQTRTNISVRVTAEHFSAEKELKARTERVQINVSPPYTPAKINTIRTKVKDYYVAAATTAQKATVLFAAWELNALIKQCNDSLDDSDFALHRSYTNVVTRWP